MKIIKQSAHIVTDWPKMNLYERCEFAGRISHASEEKIKEGSAEEFVRRMVRLGHESVFEFARIDFRYGSGMNLRTLREGTKRHLKKPLTEGFTYERAHAVTFAYPAFFDDIEQKCFWKSDDGGLYKEWKEANDWIPVLITTNRAISHQLVRYRKDVVYLQQSQRYVKFHDDIDFISPEVYFEMGKDMYGYWLDAMQDAEKDYLHCLSKRYSAQAARLFLPNSAATKLIMYASPDTWRHVFEQRISDKADPMIRELLTPLKEEFEKENLL